jgi:CDP-glucose 4,6-dehydratase
VQDTAATGRTTPFEQAFAGRTVLVTGHTGFKGGWLALWLAELGARVIGYALPCSSEPSMFGAVGLARMVTHVEGDVRDYERLRAVWQACRPDIVFHLAAQAIVSRSVAAPVETVSTNVLGTTHVLELARESTWPVALVCVTSDKCYENVESVYGYRETDALGGADIYSGSKAAAEVIISSYRRTYFKSIDSPAVASARAGNVIGGGDWSVDRLVPDCIRALVAGAPVVLRHPGAVRPWQHVLDALSGYLTIGARLIARGEDSMASRTAWNFGPVTEDLASVQTVVTELVRSWGSGEVLIAPSAPFAEATLLRLSIDKAHAHLHWQPRWRLARAVGETVNWYRAYYGAEDALNCSRAQIRAYGCQRQWPDAA